jgi:hypothetical protein
MKNSDLCAVILASPVLGKWAGQTHSLNISFLGCSFLALKEFIQS